LAPIPQKSQIAPNVTQAPKRILAANTTTYGTTTTPYPVSPNLTVYYQFSTEIVIYYMNTTTWTYYKSGYKLQLYVDANRNSCRIDFIVPNSTTGAKNSIKGTVIWNTMTGRYLTYVPTAPKLFRCMNSS
jgi:hypothetical protein